jgi:hypothetical protein
MAAVAERVVVRAAATAHQHGGRLPQPQLIGDPTGSEVGAITEPPLVAPAAAAELVHPSWQFQRLGTRPAICGFRHHQSPLPTRFQTGRT